MRAVLSALLVCVASPALHANTLTPRPLLATGDAVPGFGRIGTGGFSLLGMADDGRLLVAGNLSDGRQGLFWANDHHLAPLWISGDTPGVTLDVQHAVASGNGNVMVFAYAGNQWNAGFYYVFSQGAVPRVVVPARTDRAGNTLCWIDAAVINDAGTIAFHATIVPPGTDCTTLPDWPLDAIYIANAAWTNEVVSSTDLMAPDALVNVYMRLIGLTRDGTVIASLYESPPNAERIFAVRDGVVRTLLAPGDPGPDGEPLTGISADATNAVGEVLFTASVGAQSGLYRTDQGRIINVGRGGDTATLSDGGDVAILAAAGSNWGGISLISSGGTASQIFAPGSGTAFGRHANGSGPLLFNATGSLAFTVNAYGGPASLVALRWTAGQIDEVLASGDAAPDGTALASGGIQKPMCLAADGRVVVGATATSGSDALLCIDAAGPHVVAQYGDPIPEGFTFTGFEGPCMFTDDGGIIFAGDRTVPGYGDGQLYSETSVYRASAQGIERLFGDGDPVSNGTLIAGYGSSVNFVPNHRGSLLVDSHTNSSDDGLFLRHDGRLDLVQPWATQWGLGDDDSVVMIDRLIPTYVLEPGVDYWDLVGGGGDTVLVWNHGFLHLVATLNTPLPGAPFWALNNLMVRGDLVLFSATSRSDHQLHEFFFRLGDSQPHEVSPASVAGHIVDFNQSGQILTQAADGFELFAPTGAVTDLIAASTLNAFALSDAGTIAFVDYLQSGRDVLEIAGPGPSATCPVVPTLSKGSAPTATPTPTPTPDLSASPLPGIGTSRAYIADQATDTVAIVDTATQVALAVVPVPHAPSALAATADGRRVYVVGKDEIGVIDARTAQLIMAMPLPQAGNVIAAGPDDDTVYAVTLGSAERIARVDTGSGIVSSVSVSPLFRILGFAPGGTTAVVAKQEGGSALISHVAFIDTETGSVVSSSPPGICPISTAFGPNLSDAYVVDGCHNALELVDVQTGQVTQDLLTEQWSGQLGRLTVAADGSRAYASQPSYSMSANPDGSLGPAQGAVSAIDLLNHSATTISVPGQSDHLALTPDGSLLYVTIPEPGPGRVAVVDTASNTVRTVLLLGGAPADVVVAPAPDAPAPSPTVSGNPNVLLRADSAAGVPGDSVPFNVRLDTGGRDVGSIEADLSFDAGSLGPPGCALAPGVNGNATIEFEPTVCQRSCVGYRFVVRSADPRQSLPHAGALLACSLYVADYPYLNLSTFPLLLLNASATAPDGTPLPVTTGDGSITLLAADQATPRPTLTATPTAVPSATATPTVPVSGTVAAGSVSGGAGEVAAVPITIDTGGTDVAFFAATFMVVPQADAPAITDALTYETAAGFPAPDVEAAVQSQAKLAIGYVGVTISPPLTGKVQVGDLLVPIPAGGAGSYQVHLSEISAGDASGARVTLVGQDGTITLREADSPTPTATVPSADVPTPTPVPTVTSGVAANNQQAAQGPPQPRAAMVANGGGCAIAPPTRGGSTFWLIGTLAAFALRRVLARKTTR